MSRHPSTACGGSFRITVLSFLFSWCVCAVAADVESEVKFNEVYISPITKKINQSTHSANEEIRRTLNGKKVSIPVGWRLVSVVPKAPNDYVMFFQDQEFNVHSLAVDASGALSGKPDFLFIPATGK